ncbi:hypothetical protein, partial [Exiguobacterium indicum]|uniref:hypothetical protein n=1 Tax=Exiguobacterium indicum TaxID=296995 RepID=UPI002B256771
IKYFRTPKASLSRMTVTLADYSGQPFDFGADGPTEPLKEFQNTFVFKITTLEKKRTLGHRNVF